jgi:hypothetical protein
MRRIGPVLCLLVVACGGEPPVPAPPSGAPASPNGVSGPVPTAVATPMVPTVVEPPPAPAPPIVLAETPSPLVSPAIVEARLPEGFVAEERASDHVLLGREHRGTFDGAGAVVRVRLMPAGATTPPAAMGERVGELTLAVSAPPVSDGDEWVGGTLYVRRDRVDLTLELRCATEANCARSAELLRAIATTFRIGGRLASAPLADYDAAREIELAPGFRFALPGGDDDLALASVDATGTTFFVLRDGVEIMASTFADRCERNRLPGRDAVTAEFGGRSHEFERIDEGMISWSLCEDLGSVRWSVDVTFDGEEPGDDEREVLAELPQWFMAIEGEGGDPPAAEPAAPTTEAVPAVAELVPVEAAGEEPTSPPSAEPPEVPALGGTTE